VLRSTLRIAWLPWLEGSEYVTADQAGKVISAKGVQCALTWKRT
jgi:hypothetical protein